MKIKSKQYATALFESLDGQGDKEQKEIIKNFVKFLVDNNNFSKLEEIMSYFEKMWNEKEGITEAEIILAKSMDTKILEELKNYIQKKADSKSVIITEKQDKKIIGGVIIRHGDKSIDLSLKNKLNKLKSELIG